MSRDLRDLLIQAGNRTEGAGPAALLDRVERQLGGEPTTGLVPARGSGVPGWVVAAVSAAAAIVLLGVPFLLLRNPAPDATGPPAAPDTTQATTSAPAATDPPATRPDSPIPAGSLNEQWHLVLDAPSPQLWGTTAAGEVGIITVGWGTEPSSSFIAFSPDGTEWTETGASILQASGYLLDVAASGDAFVAVGGTCGEMECPQEQAIWRSIDGTSWERVRPEGSPLFSCSTVEAWWECFTAIDEIAGQADGFLATGWRGGDPAAPGPQWSVLASEDGRSWNLLGMPDLADLGHPEAQTMLDDPTATVDLTLRPLGRIGDRWFLWIQLSVMREPTGLGSLGPGEEWDTMSMMAASADGADWEPVPVFDDPDGAVSVMASIAGPDRLVVVGSASGSAAAWVTSDGLAWEQAGMDGDADDGRLVAIEAVGDGYVAVGETAVVEYASGDAEPEMTGEAPTIWESEDGTAWVRVDLAGMPWTRFGSIAALRSSLYASGSQWPPDGEGVTGVWRHDLTSEE